MQAFMTAAVLFGLPVLCWGLRLHLPDRVYQGDLILGRAHPPASIFVNGKACTASGSGYFAVGVSRNQETDFSFRAGKDSKQTVTIVRVLAFPWTTHKIDGLPERYITPSEKDLKRIREDNLRVASVRASKGSADPLFLAGGFVPPVHGPITGPFGARRILNGKPRAPHSGVDFAAPEGSTVRSPAAGIVALAANGMFLMGNVLMIDHGLGVRSIFIHLERIVVKEGERVAQGQNVATVGKTGRATGPHLHWGVSVGLTPIDPNRLPEKTYRIPW